MNANSRIITTYAKSLFQNLTSGKLGFKGKESFNVSTITSSEDKRFDTDPFIVGEELLLIRAILVSSKKIEGFFKNPTYSEEQKFEVILNIFPGLTTTTKSFLKILTERTHLYLIPEISDEYTKIIEKFKKISKVKIITASVLSPSFGPMLLKALKNLTNSQEIILTTGYNPKLLGGIVIEYNSMAIDASVLKEFSLFFNEI